MRIIVHVLLHLEGLVRLLHLHADIDIQRLSSLRGFLVILAIYGELRIVGILHPTPFIFFIFSDVYTFSHKLFIQFVQQVELTRQVYHRARLPLLVNHKQRRNTGRFCHESIIRTKGRRDMHDTRTILYGHIITRNYPERLRRSITPIALLVQLNRLHPRKELFVLHTDQIRSLIFANHLKRHQLVARLVIFQSDTLGLLVEMRIEQSLSQYDRHLLTRISIIGLNRHIINFRTDTKRGIRRQRPRSGGPCEEVRRTPLCHFRFWIFYLKLSHDRQVFHIPVTPRLVQLV